jgi:thiol-disulfide isomerase/thioredoxin
VSQTRPGAAAEDSSSRVRAPELVGRGGWLNSGGVPLSLAGMRGRFVLIDFWIFCCVNCQHVLDEMRPLEDEYADVLTVVGVNSPKFAHESDHEAVAAAVERYGVNHPVLDDPDLTTWQAARSWSATPATTAWSSSPTTSMSWSAGSGAGSVASPTVTLRWRGSANPRVCAASVRRRRAGRIRRGRRRHRQPRTARCAAGRRIRAHAGRHRAAMDAG